MSSSPQSQPPSPAHFFDTLNAYQRTRALKGAIELDLFTAIGEGNNSAKAIAARCQASERGIRILCDYLVIIEFLVKDAKQYRLTPDSAMFLDRRSPAYMGTAERFLTSTSLVDAFTDMAGVVRKGGTLGGHGTMEPEHPIWVEFARAMAPLVAMPAQQMAAILGAPQGKPSKVLDIAAGHGTFGITIAKQNPNAAIFAVDWPKVLEVATENAQKAGVASRHHTIPGSAFDVDLRSGYDIVLLTNFLHHFDPPTCEKLLRKIRAAAVPGARVATLEFIPNEDRISPPTAAAFSLIMLASTEHGDAYTFAELDQMFKNAGFSRSELHELPPGPGRLVLSYN
jgi:SAM-dependent methyltransferase